MVHEAKQAGICKKAVVATDMRHAKRNERKGVIMFVVEIRPMFCFFGLLQI
jgi:hypothetical protein